MKFGFGIAIVALATVTWGKNCFDGQFEFGILPSEIGSPANTTKTAYPLRCDTVLVPKGRKTTIHAGSFLYFMRNHPANLIRVEGTLEIRGVDNHYVTLAGGRDLKSSNLEPSKALWSGILVEPEGRLEMEFVGVHGAPTAITAFSPHVKILKSYFANSSGIVKPDGTLYELDADFAAVNFLDLSGKIPASNSEVKSTSPESESLNENEKEKLFKKKSGGIWSRPSTWVIGGGVVLASAMGGYFLFQPEEAAPNKPPAVPPTPGIQPDPLPGLDDF